MGVKKSHVNWRITEIRIIKENAGCIDINELVKLLPRHSRQSITNKANDMGFYLAKWSGKEIEIFKRDYPKLGAKGVKQSLPHRTMEAIHAMAKRLKVKRKVWPKHWLGRENPAQKLGPAEIEAIMYYRHSVWPGKKTSEIAKSLGVHKSTVQTYINRAKPDYIPPQFRGPL